MRCSSSQLTHISNFRAYVTIYSGIHFITLPNSADNEKIIFTSSFIG